MTGRRFDSTRKFDIRAVLMALGAEYVPPGRGGRAKMRCIDPAHPDKTPSATVDFQANRFRCWSCGLTGDGIELIMRLEGLDFHAAIARCEAIVGGASPPTRAEPEQAPQLFGRPRAGGGGR